MTAAAVAAILFAIGVVIGTVERSPHPTATPPSYLGAQLGEALPVTAAGAGGPRTIRPSAGVAARFGAGSVRASGPAGVVSLASADAGDADWQNHRNGVARPTAFGAETVTVSADRIEESLVVGTRQGTRTWRWRIGAPGMTPRVAADGSIGFLDGRRVSEAHIRPVAILDADGADITPDGLAWQLERRGGADVLALTLDDGDLPTPYVIDPAIVVHGTPAAATNGTTATTTLTLPVPVGIALNDLMLAQVTVAGGTATTITPPVCGCWTLVRRDDAGTSLAQAVYRRAASGSEPASYTWTITSNRASGGIVGYQGVDLASPVDANSGATDATGASAAVAAPAVTTTRTNDMLVGFFGVRATATFTPPATMTERFDGTAGSGSGPASAAADVVQAATGSSGALTATASAAGDWVGQLLALSSDTTNPANSLALSSVSPSGSAYLSGTTLWYRGTGGGAGGSFQLTNTVTDAGSGPASSAFPALGGTTTGWTHSAQTVSSPAGGPYVSTNAFSWSEGTSSAPTEAVVGADNAGNTATTTLTLTNDSTNPTGAVTAPASSASVRGAAVAVSSSSADAGSGVSGTTFQRSPTGAGTWTTISTDASAPYSVNWDTTGVADGLFDLRVLATDNVGNTSTSATVSNVRVDNTAPTGSVTAPASSASVGGAAVTVSSNSADAGSGVASVSFERSPAGAGTWTAISSDASAPYSVSWNTTLLSDGLYDLRAVTTDNAGGTSTSALITNVRVDNTNPTGALTAPASSAIVRGSAVALTSNSADGGSGVATATFQRSPAGAGTWTTISSDASAPYTGTWNTTLVSDGLYDLRVVTTDGVGNQFASALATNVRVDNTNPTGSVTAPASSATVSGSSVAVSSNSADGGSGVASVTFERSLTGAGSWTTIGSDTTAPYSVTWDTTVIRDLFYDLRAVTTDNAGNTFTSSLATNIKVTDITAPANGFSLYLQSPSGSSYLSGNTVFYRGTGGGSGGSFQLTNSVYDLGSLPLNSQFPALGGVTTGWTHTGQTVSTPTNGPFTTTNAFTWTEGTTSSPTEAVTSTDNVGLQSTTTLTFTNDSTNPTGSVTAPAASSNIRQTVAVTSNSADGGSGVGNTTFQRSPAGAGTWTTISTDASAPYSVNWDTTGVSDGLYDLRVVTADNVGNSTTSATITNVRVDNTAPTGSVTSPAASANLRLTVAADANSADVGGSGVASVVLQHSPSGAGTWTDVATELFAPYQWSLDTTGVSDGLYDLRAVTTDNAGNTFTSPLVTVRVDNTNPANSFSLSARSPAGSSYLTGSTIYYRGTGGGSGGSFQLTDTVTDGGSGPASAAFPALGGITTGWTHTTQTVSTPTGGPYTTTNAFTWTEGTTSSPTETVTGADNAGNTSAAVLTFTNDSTNPTGSVTAPAASSNIRQTVAVTSNSADGGSGVGNTTFQRSPAGAGTWTTISTDASAPYSVNWDTTGVSDGLYDLRVVTADNVGNSTTSATITNVRVDNTNPTGSVTAPAAAANLRGAAVSVTSDSADGGSGVASAAFQRSPAGAGTWTTISTDTGAPYAATWDTTAVTDGLYDLRVVTTDNAGNAATSATVASVRVDNTNPTGSITAPTTGANMRGTAFTYASDSADAGSGVASAVFQGSPGGANSWTTVATDTTAPYAFNYDTTSVPDGIYEVRVITTDNAGNSVTSAAVTNLRVDNTNPSAPSVSGGSLSWQSVASVAVTGSGAADAGSGLSGYEYRTSTDAGSTWSSASTGATATISAEGETLVQFRSVDNAGNTSAWTPASSTAGSTVRIDRTAATDPSVTGGSTSWQTVASVTVQASGASDSGSGLTGYQYRTSTDAGSTWSSATSGASLVVSAEGETLVQFRSVDGAGNTGAWTPASAVAGNTVRLDRTAPSAPTVAGGSAAWNQSPATITITGASSTDAASGLSGYEYRTSTDGGTTWSAAAAGASVGVTATGETLVQYRALDVAGNSSAWTPSHSPTPTDTGTARITNQIGVDLANSANVHLRIDGQAADDGLGEMGVFNAGDVNGDGRPDLIVGAPYADNNARSNSGSVYVVWGQATPATIDLASLGANGFRIDGATAGDVTGYGGGPAGDVNGDGLQDVLVGSHGASFNGRSGSGSAYVVFGKAGTTTVDLAALGSEGYRIDGATANESAGVRVATAGDVNGDGLADALISARLADNNARADSGSVYVVFGKASTSAIDLAALGSGGYRVDGTGAGDWLGNWVANAGDVNGDGRPDAILGARLNDGPNGVDSGAAYVVFGKTSSTTIDTAALGADGYRIDGASAGDNVGWRVSGAGDVNGDGTPDQIVSAPYAGYNNRPRSGSVYVIWGKSSTTTIDLNALGGGGYRIDGTAALDDAGGGAVFSVADINGDGIPEQIVGARGEGVRGRAASGAAYMVYGSSSTATVDLRSATSRVLRFDGAAAGDALGGGATSMSDITGDGRPEVILSGWAIDNNGRSNSGSVYVVPLTVQTPTATTDAPSGLTTGLATLNGTVNPNGQATTWYIEWGATTAYGSQTAPVSAGSGTAPVLVSKALTGLTYGQTINYRVVATNAYDYTTYGANRVFTATDTDVPSAPTTVSGGSLSWQSVASVAVTASGGLDTGGSGLSGYEYRTSGDGGATWSSTATTGATATISEQGETIVQFRSVDGAGNRSAWTPASSGAGDTVRIDRTAPGGAAGSEVVSGGDFETPSIGAGPLLSAAPATTGSWNLTAGTATGLGTAWQAGDGVQSVELNGSGPGTFSQTLATTTGAVYRLQLKVAGDPDGGPAVKEMRINWGGSTLRTVRFDTTGRTVAAMGWQTVTLEATASSSSTILEFESLTAGSYGPAIDAVSVTPRPGPTVAGGSLSWQSTASATVTGSGSTDAHSGLSGYEYRTSTDAGSTWGSATTGASLAVSAEGETLVQYRSIDNAGNASEWAPASATAGSTVRIDRTDPTVPTVSGGSLSWQSVASVAVTASGGNGGDSGLAGYEYRTSTDAGSTWSSGTAGASATVSAEGETLVQFRSLDNAGNASAWTPSSATAGSTVRIDRTNPGTPTVSGGSLAWQSVADLTITASAGVGASSYEKRTSTDSGATWSAAAAGASATISAEGETLVQFRSVDDAGNVSAWAPGSATAGSTARIDRTAPTTPTVSGGSLSWQSVASVAVTASGGDGGDSGLAGYEYRTSIDSGPSWGTATAGASATISAEGETLVQFRSLDGAGNASAWSPSSATAGSTVRIDRTDPGTPTVSGGSLSWQDVPDITITASSGSGAVSYEHRTSTDAGSSWSTATAGGTVIVSAEGETLVQFRSVDDAGNVSAWTPGSATAGSTARIDRTDPTTPTVVGGSLSWQSVASVAVTASGGSGGDSGLAGYEYRTSTDAGSSWGTATAGASATISAEGETLVQYRSIDGAGNSSAWAPSSATAGSTVRIDRTDPTVPTVSGGALSWQNVASVAVTASGASGGDSGLAGYEYRTSTDSGATWSGGTAGSSVTVSDEGETLVQYRSLDGAGNASAWTPSSATAGSTVRIDRTDPGAPTVSGGSLSWQNVADITITASAGTGASSYEKRTSTDSGATWSTAAAGASATINAEGETLVQFRSVDDAGNVSAWTPGSATAGSTARIDRTDPTAPTVAGGSLSWQSVASVAVTASGGDGGDSGLAGYEYRTSADAGATWSAAAAGASVTVSDEGETLVQYRSLDGAGNASAWTPSSPTAGSTVRIDRTGPGTPTVSGGSLSWQSVADITITASAGTGASSYEHRTSTDAGSTWGTATAGGSVVVSAEGETLVQFRSIDNAGNASEWAPASATAGSTVRIDRTDPTVPTVSGGSLSWQSVASVAVTASGGNGGDSGLAGYEYRTSTDAGSTWSSGTAGASATVSAEGETLVQFRSLDNAGNASAWTPSSATAGSTVRIDRTGPGAPTVSGGSLSWQNVPDITVTASSGAGAVSYEHRTSTDSGSTWSTGTAGSSVTVAAEGETLVQFRSVDDAGNVSAWTPSSANAGSTARIDRTDPTVPTVSGGSLAWQGAASVTVTASGASGGDSGLAGYEHRTSTDGGATWGAPASGASVAISALGETLVQYRAVDGAANVSAWAPTHLSGPDADATVRLGALALGTARRVSTTGPDGDAGYDALWPDVAHNASANEYLIVWTGDTGSSREDEVWGRLTTGGGEAIGEAFRISSLGPEGNASYTAWEPRAVYNPAADEYLVVWFGDDDAGALADNEFEVYAQRVSAEGAEVGPDDVRISSMGPDGDASFDAWNPRVAYDGDDDEYLVVWEGDDNAGGSVDNASEIFGQRLSATLTEIGTDDVRISSMGPEGNAAFDALRPDVAYNPVSGEYLVAWQGDDDTAPLVDNEQEIFVQRLSASGAAIGTDDMRISDMGADGAATADAVTPALAVDRTDGDYLVAWSGDDASGGLVDDEHEIFVQRITGAGAEAGVNDRRISSMGPDGAAEFGAHTPAAAWNAEAGQYLVTWSGTDDASGLADSELEVYAQPLLGDGSEAGSTDIRVSEMGPDGDASFGVGRASVASGTGSLTFLAAWDGSDDAGALVAGENEIHSRLIAIDPTAPTAPSLTGGSALWRNAVSDTITASGSDDAESGLAGYERRTSTDGGSTWSPAVAGASVTVTDEGETLVQFRAVNGNGDQSTWVEAVVRLDRTDPADPTATGGSASWTGVGPVTVTGGGSSGGPSGTTWEHRTSTDAGSTWSASASGVAVAVGDPGETLVQFRVVDGAGNTSGWAPAAGAPGATVRLDLDAPTAPVVSGGSASWQVTPSITISASGSADPGGSGVAGYERRSSTDGGATWSAATAGGSAVVTDEGETLVQFRALDAVGNASSWTPSPGDPAGQARIDNGPPPAPTGLAGPATTSVAPVLTWTPVAGAASYVVTRDGTPVGTPTGASFTDSTVPGEGSYVYRAIAVDGPGNQSAPSGTVTVEVDTTPPPAPSEGGISGGSAGWTNAASVVITGTPPSGATLQHRTSTDGGGVWSGPSAGAVATVTAAGETIVQFRAVDPAGNLSAWVPATASAATTARIDRTAPAVPGGLTGGGVTSAQPVIGWTAVAGASGYRVLRDGAEVGTTAGTGFTDSALTAGGSYLYRVIAVDEAGNASAPSAGLTVEFAPADVIPPNTTIASAPASPTMDPTPTIALSATEPATYECSVDSGPWTACATPVTIAALADGSHTIAARARDTAGNVDASPAQITLVVDTVAPPAPALTATADTSLPLGSAAGRVLLTMTGAGDAVRVVVTQGPRTVYDGASAVSVPDLVADGATHAYEAVGVDAAGNVSSSVTASATTPDRTPPAAPAGPNGAGYPLALTWTAVPDTAQYVLARDGTTALTTGTASATDAGAIDAAAPPAPSGVSANVLGSGRVALSWAAVTDAGTAYTMAVQAVDAVGNASVFSPGTSLVARSGIATYSVLLDGSPLVDTVATSLDVDGLAPGSQHTLSLVAVDAAGNTSTASAPIVVTIPADPSTAPRLRVSVDRAYARPGDAVTFTAALEGAGTGPVTWTLDSGVQLAGLQVQHTYSTAGRRMVRAVVSGSGGQTASSTVEVIVDATPPAMDLVLGGGRLAVTGSDAESGVQRIEWIPESGGAPRQLVNGGIPLKEGRNLITIRVIDRAGNVSEAVRELIGDTRAPALEIRAPAMVQKPRATVTLAVTDAGSGLAAVEYAGKRFTRVPARLTVTAGKPVTVTAIDVAGNRSVATFTVRRIPSAPKGARLTWVAGEPRLTGGSRTLLKSITMQLQALRKLPATMRPSDRYTRKLSVTVAKYQRAARLRPTGIVDAATRARLARDLAKTTVVVRVR